MPRTARAALFTPVRATSCLLYTSFRSDQARTPPGSGLGLSIVAQTIKAHGGWVKAGRSATGGAEFTIRLPGSSVPPGDPDPSDITAETVVLPRVLG